MRRLKLNSILGLMASTLYLSAMTVQAEELHIVRYTRAELSSMPKSGDFIQSHDFANVMGSKLKDVLILMTQRQSGSNVASNLKS